MPALITKYFENLSTDQIIAFSKLEELYRFWNQQINVISRKDIDLLYERHILHSLAIARVIDFKSGTKILDVGTGGGFPGIPLAIFFPHCEFTLVDSIGKKIKVVNEVAKALQLKNVSALHTRAESLNAEFDFVVSRAVTEFPVFYNWVKGKFQKKSFNDLPNGILYLKGGDLKEEFGKFYGRSKFYELSNFFKEEFFETKKAGVLPYVMSARSLIVFFILLSAIAVCQHHNRLNRNGQRKGKWLIYSDSNKTKKLFEGKFRNGRSVGKALYYNMEGQLDRREISRFNRILTTTYYSNGTINQCGKSRIVISNEKIHYYYYGRWKQFDEQKKLVKYYFYEKGRLVRTEYVDKKNPTNDSLIYALNELDQHFLEFNAILLDSISDATYNPIRTERLETELFMTDTFSFKQIERIFKNYGFPQKKIAMEATVIPFYILSFAPVFIKEKYLSLLVDAANAGDLSWSSLAFYVDKINVAKQKPQVYGTQFYISSDRRRLMYPVEDPELLHERRKKAGLDLD